MNVKLLVGLVVFMVAISIASVSAQYPTVATGGTVTPDPKGPQQTTGNNYSFIVDVPRGTFLSVQVIIDGIAYDLEFTNAAWRGVLPARPGQTYSYLIVTRSGLTIESSKRML